MARALACPDCDARYAPGPTELWRCACGHPLEFADPPVPDAASFEAALDDRDAGLWAFAEAIPVEPRVSLGEGFTPLVDAPAWDAQFKLEYVFPTGSFKDRGATTLLSRAVELGVETVLEDSSGNAGAAIATYAARAGIDAEIYVPADVTRSKLAAIERAGATPIRVEGDREAVTAACVEAVERGDGWYGSHAWNPAFYAGTATVAFEVCAQRAWTAPDAVVLPVGHGTLFLGAARGFSMLRDAGVIDARPRLLGAQAVGHAPIADAVGGGDTEEEPTDVADGIAIADPARGGEIRDAIDATDGDAIAVGSDAIEEALAALHRGGFYVEPTAAVAPAALGRYREQGVLDADADVVVALTGSGLKATSATREIS